MQSDRGYSKSTNMDVERCSESSVPRKKLLHKEWVIGDASDSLVLDIFLFVGNRDCQLQLHIVDENEITTESYPGHDCVLCQTAPQLEFVSLVNRSLVLTVLSPPFVGPLSVTKREKVIEYQPLPCKTSSNVDIHALVDFSFSRTNSRTYVDFALYTPELDKSDIKDKCAYSGLNNND
uniref:Uncharacterized protein n=1 Tax=Romanomermis culicivorax TaxID=13658 RepID=A0A915JWU5_ROMCU